ncbi:hypothetical protein CBR_g49766 [Chara braunii]|uniref:Integrase catalytic domain-containing protein n=1 Tax=Chara braunii TaxID=69332 RepID=A0A388M5U7_CHABU|nr:hypothetical protein CBR_g49766 [Chara braunii]|eukprot:GBG89916.1 hypothetical protein CBR_g49766 [Chara braunii]
MPDAEKFRQVPKYVWWEMRPEVMRVASEANDNWANFKVEMQRRYRLGDGLLTVEDLERLERSDFTTIGAFATAFEKFARKVPGLAEETQCAIFLSSFTECERVSLTRKGVVGRKLTWETITQSLADGELDQVYQFQMKQQRQKRKARAAAETAGINLQQLITDGIAQYQATQQKPVGKKVMVVTQPATKTTKKGKTVEQVEEEDEEEEEEEPVKLTKNQRKARNQAMGGQGTGKGVQTSTPAQANANQVSAVGVPPQAQASPPQWPEVFPTVWPGFNPCISWPDFAQQGQFTGGFMPQSIGGCANASSQGGEQQQQQAAAPKNSQPNQGAGQGQGQQQGGNGQGGQGRGGGGRGRGFGNGGQGRRGGGWNGQGGGDRPRFDWRNATCHHCTQKGHTLKFCQIRKMDEEERLISSNLDGDIYDKFEEYIDPKVPGGIRKEALRPPKLHEEFKARLSRRRVASVRRGNLIPAEAHWATPGTKMDWKSVATGSVNLVIKGKSCNGMLDTGAEMNIIKEADALRLGLDIDREDMGFLYGASGRTPFIGTAANVVVEVGKVKVRSCFYVMPNLDHPLLLGRSFLCRTESVILNKHDDTIYVILSDPVCGNYEIITCHNTSPRGMRNRPNPGSFTFEESEEERRRLMEKDEVESEPYGEMSLSLTSINDAMEIVSAYGMADPVAVQALKERVADGEGEVELVYRLPMKEGDMEESQGHESVSRSQDPVKDMEEDEFEEGEITEAFRAEEYDSVYRELGLLLSCEIREREASLRVHEMRSRFVVRDEHLFIKNEVRNPRRVICGRHRQIDMIAALHDGLAGGHRAFALTYAKARELYYWEGMSEMIRKYCESCVPCQIRASTKYKEPLHPRIERDAGAVVYLDLLAMPPGVGGYNYIFDARDNLTGFVDGRVIRNKTGETLAICIMEYFLRYPFVMEFVMDRGSEFTCGEVKDLLRGYGVKASYTTRAHPQANAPVERGHTTLTSLLAKWTDGKENQWPKHLRAAFFVENITIKRSTKYAPASLWYRRHATLPIESFLTTWRRQGMETNLTFEELLDLRARQVGIAEEKIQEVADGVMDSRMKDKERWDRLPRVRKEPLEVGDVVLLYESSLEKQWPRYGLGSDSGIGGRVGEEQHDIPRVHHMERGADYGETAIEAAHEERVSVVERPSEATTGGEEAILPTSEWHDGSPAPSVEVVRELEAERAGQEETQRVEEIVQPDETAVAPDMGADTLGGSLSQQESVSRASSGNRGDRPLRWRDAHGVIDGLPAIEVWSTDEPVTTSVGQEQQGEVETLLSLGELPVLEEAQTGEEPQRSEDSLTTLLYTIESPSLLMQQEESQLADGERETQRIEDEVLRIDPGAHMDDLHADGLVSSPLVFDETPRRDDEREGGSMGAHAGTDMRSTQDEPETQRGEPSTETQRVEEREQAGGDTWLAEEMRRMPPLRFPSWEAFEQVGQAARPVLSEDQRIGGLRVLHDDLTLQRDYIARGLTAARQTTEDMRDYARRVATRSFELCSERQEEHEVLGALVEDIRSLVERREVQTLEEAEAVLRIQAREESDWRAQVQRVLKEYEPPADASDRDRLERRAVLETVRASQLESQISTLVRLRRETEERTMQLFYEDATTAGWQEEVRLRRQTGAEPMPTEEQERAEAGLQARLLSEASVRELAEVMQHVRRLSRSEVERGETLQDVVRRMDALERENRGLRDTVQGLSLSMESLRRLTLHVEQRVLSFEQGQRTRVPTGPVGERASGGSYSTTERMRVFRETEPWTLGLGVTRQDSWAEGSMGVRPASEGETSTVDKFMLAICEVAPVGQGQVRTMDQTPPVELGIREGVVEPRDGILRDGAQDPYVTPFGTLPTAASPSPDVMEEVARGLAQRSAA